jgi:(Z)-2-((N-methylformamido)methylene)-5-hydroxybutyrolactone dehydrogenase
MQTYGHYIDGAYVEPASGEYIDSHTPYSGEVWARIPRANAEDADRAVAAPARAMREGPWAGCTPPPAAG